MSAPIGDITRQCCTGWPLTAGNHFHDIPADWQLIISAGTDHALAVWVS